MPTPANPAAPRRAGLRPGRLAIIAALTLILTAAVVLLIGQRASPGAAEAAAHPVSAPADAQPLGLFTSLPLLWSKSPDLAGLLAGSEPPHWASSTIAARHPIEPLDTLSASGEGSELAALGLLLMAQPRPLSGDANVALDDWVRRGGRVLLFADPALTWDSAYALGDKRRPQDIAMLSPILARWGLELTFDEDQPLGEREVDLGSGTPVPVNLPGALIPRRGGFRTSCTVSAAGLVARCRIGKGRATVIADAALFEPAAEDAGPGPRQTALAALLGELATPVLPGK